MMIHPFLCLLILALPIPFESYLEPLNCYKCDGNNEECSLATMHSDIAKYTVRCVRDYRKCITILLEHDGRKIYNKRCADDRICQREEKHCNESERKTKGGLQTEKICHAWCCEGDWCNHETRVSPVHLIIVVGFVIAALMYKIYT